MAAKLVGLGTGPTLIHEGHRLGPLHVAGFQVIDVKAGRLDECGDRPIQVAAAADAFPRRGQEVLPAAHGLVRRPAVLDAEQLYPWREHAGHIAERTREDGDSAERPGEPHRAYAAVLHRIA